MNARIIVFVLMTLNAVSLLAEDLASYHDKNRVLVALASNQTDPRLAEQRELNAQAANGFAERDLVFISETDASGPLHRQFGVNAKSFRILLIGKDGHTALERSEPVSQKEIFQVIDAMPMRKDEMRAQGKR
jgi:hypothetical protein